MSHFICYCICTVLIRRGSHRFCSQDADVNTFVSCGVLKALLKQTPMVVATRFSRLQHLLLLQPRFQQSRVLRRPLIRTPTLIRSVMGSSSSSSSKLLFRQLFEKESSTYTYLLADISHPDKPALVSSFAFIKIESFDMGF